MTLQININNARGAEQYRYALTGVHVRPSSSWGGGNPILKPRFPGSMMRARPALAGRGAYCLQAPAARARTATGGRRPTAAGAAAPSPISRPQTPALSRRAVAIVVPSKYQRSPVRRPASTSESDDSESGGGDGGGGSLPLVEPKAIAIVGLVGRGTASGTTVRRCHHGRTTGPLIALRSFPVVSAEATEALLAALRRDAAALSGRQNHNIARMLFVSVDRRGALGVGLELANRGRLTLFLKQAGVHLPVLHRLRLMVGVALGLDELHRAGLVHGDLRPDKVLLADSDSGVRVLLSGFGAAAVSGATARRTVDFKAPETMAVDAGWTRASDMYAYSVTAYQIAAGRPAWPGLHDIDAVGAAVARGERPPIEAAPAPLRSVIADCWAAAPVGRPNAMDVVVRLRAAKHSMLNRTLQGWSGGEVSKDRVATWAGQGL